MLKRRLAIIALVVLPIFLFGLVIGVFVPRLLGFRAGPRFYPTSALVLQVQSLSQLVTVKYVVEKVVILDDVKWVAGLGENRVLIVAHAIVKAGTDLGQLTAGDIRVSGKKIVVKLPPAQITDAYLDEKQTRVIERTTGLLRSFDKDLEQTARQNAVDDIRRAAREGGILKEADERTRTQLKHLFGQLGFEDVEFR